MYTYNVEERIKQVMYGTINALFLEALNSRLRTKTSRVEKNKALLSSVTKAILMKRKTHTHAQTDLAKSKILTCNILADNGRSWLFHRRFLKKSRREENSRYPD